MTTDPIVDLFVVFIRRLLYFIIMSVLIASLVWFLVLTKKLGVPDKELATWLSEGWSPVKSIVPEVFFIGALIIGTLSTCVIYLIVGRWWKKRATVRHHRGGRIEDSEE